VNLCDPSTAAHHKQCPGTLFDSINRDLLNELFFNDTEKRWWYMAGSWRSQQSRLHEEKDATQVTNLGNSLRNPLQTGRLACILRPSLENCSGTASKICALILGSTVTVLQRHDRHHGTTVVKKQRTCSGKATAPFPAHRINHS
jgi:hypothetical protein